MTLKFAIAGAGFIANVHAQAILANNREVVCVVEKFADKAEIFMAKFGIPKRFETVDELVKMGGVDALIIGTPNLLHAPQTIAALNAGMHVLVEKPMAMNAAEAQQMVIAAKRSGKALMVGLCWRFDPDVLWLKAQTGKIGKIIRTKGYGVHTNWGPAGWFTQKALAGGGALADMGIHALDTARFRILNLVGGSRILTGQRPELSFMVQRGSGSCSQLCWNFPMRRNSVWMWSNPDPFTRAQNTVPKAFMTSRWRTSSTASTPEKPLSPAALKGW